MFLPIRSRTPKTENPHILNASIGNVWESTSFLRAAVDVEFYASFEATISQMRSWNAERQKLHHFFKPRRGPSSHPDTEDLFWRRWSAFPARRPTFNSPLETLNELLRKGRSPRRPMLRHHTITGLWNSGNSMSHDEGTAFEITSEKDEEVKTGKLTQPSCVVSKLHTLHTHTTHTRGERPSEVTQPRRPGATHFKRWPLAPLARLDDIFTTIIISIINNRRTIGATLRLHQCNRHVVDSNSRYYATHDASLVFQYIYIYLFSVYIYISVYVYIDFVIYI